MTVEHGVEHGGGTFGYGCNLSSLSEETISPPEVPHTYVI